MNEEFLKAKKQHEQKKIMASINKKDSELPQKFFDLMKEAGLTFEEAHHLLNKVHKALDELKEKKEI